jgi:predicted RNA-binding Zn-ribbon protein involved in translation (DUF1610 family)
MPVQQVTPITCPNCGVRFTAPIEPIINGQNLAMKSAFLQGELNVVRCPQCGFVGMPGVPTYYYDLEKELAFVFVPNGLNLLAGEQEKIIGDLTNKLINTLPAADRKFFLFNPKNFLSIESMVKAILEADGITEEVIQAQEQRLKLLEQLAQTANEAELKKLAQENDHLLDRQFFELITVYMQSAQISGDQEQMQSLLALRTAISRASSQGKQIVAEIDQELGLEVMKSRDDLLTRLETAKNDDEFEALVAAGQGLLDYGFFQQVTEKIDQLARNGNKKAAADLTTLRTKVLDIKAKHEEETKAMLENAMALVQEILKSSAPHEVIDRRLDDIDEAFFFILQATFRKPNAKTTPRPPAPWKPLATWLCPNCNNGK